jgi:molybdenum cofactor guanylyltransferase
MDPLPVYILAGGKSRRFGSDKARALFDGKPLIRHVAEAMGDAATSMHVVAEQAGKYDDLGLPTIGDLEPGLGPVGGLLTSLRHSTGPWILLSPCDFPGIRIEWIRQLLAGRRAGADAVAFRGDHWEPLPALYSQAIGDRAAAAVASGRRSLSALLEECHTVSIPLPPGWPASPGANTPWQLDELRRARTPR